MQSTSDMRTEKLAALEKYLLAEAQIITSNLYFTHLKKLVVDTHTYNDILIFGEPTQLFVYVSDIDRVYCICGSIIASSDIVFDDSAAGMIPSDYKLSFAAHISKLKAANKIYSSLNYKRVDEPEKVNQQHNLIKEELQKLSDVTSQYTFEYLSDINSAFDKIFDGIIIELTKAFRGIFVDSAIKTFK